MARGHLPSAQNRAAIPTTTQAIVSSPSGASHAERDPEELSQVTDRSEGSRFLRARLTCHAGQLGARILDDLGSLVVLDVARVSENDQLGEQAQGKQLQAQYDDEGRQQQGWTI